MSSCIIVASGPSARGFAPPENIPIIAVNGAIDWIERADYAFTLDPSPANMRRFSNHRPGVEYVMALPYGDTAPENVTRYRRIAVRGNQPRGRSSVEWLLWRLSCVKTLCAIPGCIHTGNSAWGALGLAYHLGFQHVALVGVDGSREINLDGDNSGDLRHLRELFLSALDQIDVVSCGQLDGIPQMTLEEWICKYAHC